MGFYLQAPLGVHKGKAKYLHEKHGAEIMLTPEFPTDGRVAICVVENELFEACGIAYDQEEFNVFNSPDYRPKVWLKMERAKVLAMCPEVEPFLRPKLEHA